MVKRFLERVFEYIFNRPIGFIADSTYPKLVKALLLSFHLIIFSITSAIIVLDTPFLFVVIWKKILEITAIPEGTLVTALVILGVFIFIFLLAYAIIDFEEELKEQKNQDEM